MATSERRCCRLPPLLDADRSLPVPVSPRDCRRLAAAARAGAITGGSSEDDVLRLERTAPAVPDGPLTWSPTATGGCPRRASQTSSSRWTTPPGSPRLSSTCEPGEPSRDRIGLLNVLLAEGINLGLHKMAEVTTTHGFWELMRIARWHVEGDAFDRALAVVVEAQAALPMAAFWVPGGPPPATVSSSPAAGRGEALNLGQRPVRGRARLGENTRQVEGRIYQNGRRPAWSAGGAEREGRRCR